MDNIAHRLRSPDELALVKAAKQRLVFWGLSWVLEF